MEKKLLTKTIFYRLQYIDSARYMASSLSSLTNNLAKKIDEIKCKYKHNDKNSEICRTYKDYTCFLECTNFKDDLIEAFVYVVTRTITKILMKS